MEPRLMAGGLPASGRLVRQRNDAICVSVSWTCDTEARQRRSARRASAVPGRAGPDGDAEAAVTALYEAHALGLVRLAYVMLGDRAGAEDVVQEAFGGLYRRWDGLSDKERALSYVRSSVLNGCRSALRRRRVQGIEAIHQPPAASAEAAALTGEERREVMRALRRVPGRQREGLVLRFYLDEPETEIARAMGIRPR